MRKISEDLQELKRYAKVVFSGGPIPEYSIGPTPSWTVYSGWKPLIDWWEEVAQSFQVTPRQIASLVTPRMISQGFPGADGLYLLSQSKRLKPATSFFSPPAGLVLTCLIRGGDMKRIIEREVQITPDVIIHDLKYGNLEELDTFGTGLKCVRVRDFVVNQQTVIPGFFLSLYSPTASQLFHRILHALKPYFRMKVVVPKNSERPIEVSFL